MPAVRDCRDAPCLARLLALAVIVVTASLPGGVNAQNYPWCSNFADGAGTNCGFSSEDQCRLTIAGSGGYCDRNTQYAAPGGVPAQRSAPAHSKARGHHPRS